MSRTVKWIGDCTHLPARQLEAFDATSRGITYRTFLKHVGPAVVREINRRYGHHPTIAQDGCVTFCKGELRDRSAVCMMHSGIHHIWQL